MHAAAYFRTRSRLSLECLNRTKESLKFRKRPSVRVFPGEGGGGGQIRSLRLPLTFYMIAVQVINNSPQCQVILARLSTEANTESEFLCLTSVRLT